MVVEKNKVISVVYELRSDNENGAVLEKLSDDAPLSFLVGSGKVLDNFEANLTEKKAGETFSFALNADEAYGDLNENAIVDIPKSAFEVDGLIDESMLQTGNKIPMQDKNGNKLSGIVVEASLNHVKMDFNHPLAGQVLHFKGHIKSIRDATPEEINHGHIHDGHSCNDCNCEGH
jgi:FKBP-type peptidyl-prolyl cis-trans isomerase SlyD